MAGTEPVWPAHSWLFVRREQALAQPTALGQAAISFQEPKTRSNPISPQDIYPIHQSAGQWMEGRMATNSAFWPSSLHALF